MKEMEKPTFTTKPRPSTTRGATLAQPTTHQSKAVASGLVQGGGAPMVRPHHPQLIMAPPYSGGAFNARGGRLHGCFPKIYEQTDVLKLYKKTPSSHS